MAQNLIGQTIAGMQLNKSPTENTGTPGINAAYNPAQIRQPIVEQGRASAILGSIIDFAKSGTAAFQQFDDYKTKQGDQRSNEILEKMTPEQRASALQNGTLLYQDDPWTMRALKQKVAQNASIMADSQILDNIKNGGYSSQRDLLDDMAATRAKNGQDAAALNGFDFNDPDFQKGYSTQAAERNLHLQEGYSQWQSDQIKKTKALHDSVSLNGFINTTPQSDPSITAQSIYGYIAGSGGSYDDKVSLIGQALQGLSGVSGGAQVISHLRSMDYDLYGQRVTLDDIYGKSGMEQYITKAGVANYASDRVNRDAFDNDLAIAMTTPDLATASAKVQQLSAQLDRQQPGQFDTPQRQQLQHVKESILRKQEQQNQQQQALFAKQAQSDNRRATLYGQYVSAVNGNNTAVTDFQAQTTNEASGKYTKEDSINAATQYYDNVMNNDQMSQSDKVNAVMHLAAVTPADQGMNLILKNKIATVSTEINAAGLQGKLDLGKTPNLNTMIQMYKTNPSALANALASDPQSMKLYSQVATISGMNDNGIDPTIFITGQQKMANMDQIQKNNLAQNSSKYITKTTTDSRFRGMGGLPMQISQSIFENAYASTGDIDGATELARQFLVDNVKDITNSDNGSVGQVMKSSLQVTSDPKSIQIGQQIVDSKVNDLVTQYPVLKGKLNISTAQDGSLVITDPSTTLKALTGQSYIRITKQDLAQGYNDYLRKAKEENDKAVTEQEARLRSNGIDNKTITTDKPITGLSDAYNTKSSNSLRLQDSNNKLGGLLK
ncbi:hypothetical protein ACNPN6_06600 [Enterobacter quasiroggenkampii]|uniref:hypothetical protein n=1 Tax=Enterobacter quasiroggenkampii TaxID=2497436 RepID=UPI003AAEECE9